MQDRVNQANPDRGSLSNPELGSLSNPELCNQTSLDLFDAHSCSRNSLVTYRSQRRQSTTDTAQLLADADAI